MSPVEYIVLIAAVLLGGLAGLRLPKFDGRYLHLLLSFSGAYLLSITALHLIPEAFSNNAVNPGIAVLGGFFLQVLFEQLSQGVEHGHIHVNQGRNVALPVLIGLSLHALLEGSPLALMGHAAHGHAEGHPLLTGLALHKLPAGFALSVLMLQAGYARGKVWLALGVFALMSPIGALVGEWIAPPRVLPYLLGLVIGSLLHVSTTILFELDDPDHHRLSWAKTGAIAAGIIIALATRYVT